MRNEPKACAFGTEQGEFGRLWPSTEEAIDTINKLKRGRGGSAARGEQQRTGAGAKGFTKGRYFLVFVFNHGLHG